MAARVLPFEPDPKRRATARHSSAEADRLAIEQMRADLEREREDLARQRADLETERRRLADDLRALGEYQRHRDRRTSALDLRRRLAKAGITQGEVARQAGVKRSLVSHVLAGRARSANVVDAAERILRERRP